MAMFLADIAFMLELALLVAGLYLFHSAKGNGSNLLRLAAFLAVIGSISGMACTGYYSMKYHFQGNFDSAFPQPSQMMRGGMMPQGMSPQQQMMRHQYRQQQMKKRMKKGEKKQGK